MSKAEVISIAKQFVEVIQGKYLVKMVILLQAFPGVFDELDGEIELAVVVDLLGKEDDYIDTLQKMKKLATSINPRLDIELIESKKKRPHRLL
jgi:hypothetical protein